MNLPVPDAPRASRTDRGFSLVEVMVAVALFAVLSSALLVVLNATTKTSNDDGLRIVASNLAVRELEITRDTFASITRGPTQVPQNEVTNPSPLPGGTAGQPYMVDGIPFTVRRDVQAISVNNTGGEAASACDDGSGQELSTFQVEVRVTWPGLSPRPAVTMNTIMTPRKGTYNETKGHIGVKVIDRLGAPQANVNVTATKPGSDTHTGRTTADGCVLFAFVDPGTWTVTVSEPGYVTKQGEATGTLTAGVQTGGLWRGTIDYDRAASMKVAICPPLDYPLPQSLSGIPVSLGNSSLVPSGTKSFSTTGTRSVEDCRLPDEDVVEGQERPAPEVADLRTAEVRTIGKLWPYASGYEPWVGACLDNDPQHTGQARELPVVSDPAQTTATTTQLVGIEVTKGGALTTLVAVQVMRNAAGAEVTTDNGCPSGATITLGTTILSGTLRASLPYGTWKIQRSNGTGKKVNVTVTKDGGPVSVEL